MGAFRFRRKPRQNPSKITAPADAAGRMPIPGTRRRVMNTYHSKYLGPAHQEKGLIPEPAKLVLIFVLLLAVVYLFYDNARSKRDAKIQIDRMADQIQRMENGFKLEEAALSSRVSNLKKRIADAHKAVGSAQAEMEKTAAQIQAERQKRTNEISQALSSKADASRVEAQVHAVKTEAEDKIGRVSSEVGGVKTQVFEVKNELESTRRDLEGTQRRLLDVRDSLSAAVAKNTTELTQLRLKGERNYFEFIISDKNKPTGVEDINLVLTKTNHKKGRFNLKIIVDDSRLEKKDLVINEPIQFLVGRERLRYEVVVNWVHKNKAGGYLSVPKDKILSAERLSMR
jgi:archaellum component FlaC